MKPAGSEVKLTYQTAELVAEGDAVVTGTTGRTYLVIAARRMRSSRPGPPTWALRCIVAEGEAPPGVRRHPLFWWPRGRRRA